MRKSIATTILCLTANLTALTSQLELRHREKNGVGYTDGYTTVDYYLTHNFEKPELLFNLRGHVFDDGRLASNVGLGFRYPVKEDKWLLGLNAFYDFRESKHLLAQQVGAGIEVLKRKVDFRINGYLPIGDRSYEHRGFSRFSGNEIIVRQKATVALPSAECEIGLPLTRHFYLAAAPYYLFKERKSGINFGDAWGGKLRFTIDLDRYFSIGAMATYDPIFKTTVQGVVSLKIPFGKFPKETVRKRNLRQTPIFRNEIIPFQSKKREVALFSNSNSRDSVEVFFVDNSFQGKSDGSFEAPFSSLKEAEMASSPGDIIYVFPGDGTATKMDKGIVLKDGQVLASSGTSIVVEEVEIPAQTPGEMPVITNIHPDEPVVKNPGETRLEDFQIIEPWEYLLEGWTVDYDYGGIDAGIGGSMPDLGNGAHYDHGGNGAASDHGNSGDSSFVDVGAEIDAHLDLGGGEGWGVVGPGDGNGGGNALDGYGGNADNLGNGGDGGGWVDALAGYDGAGVGAPEAGDGSDAGSGSGVIVDFGGQDFGQDFGQDGIDAGFEAAGADNANGDQGQAHADGDAWEVLSNNSSF